MAGRLARLLGALVLLSTALILGVSTPAYAGDDSCPSDRDLVGAQSDSVTIPDDHDDWWRHTSAVGYHSFTLQPHNCQAFLTVWDNSCSRVLCSYYGAGNETSTCSAYAVGTVYVLVSYFGGGIPVLYYTLSETGSTPGIQSNVHGAGVASGTVSFGGSGIPPAGTSCQATSFSFASDTRGGQAGATAGVFAHTYGFQYAGPIEVWGGGGSACESATGGTGSITAYASAATVLGSSLSCGPLTGTYLREATTVVITLTGQCAINTVGTGRVNFLATGQFVPAQAGQGVTSPVTSAVFATEFHVVAA